MSEHISQLSQRDKQKIEEQLRISEFISKMPKVKDVVSDEPEGGIQPGMIYEGRVTMFVGDPSAGKSSIVLKVIDASANAGTLFGHKHEARSIIYLDRDDNAAADVLSRMKWLDITENENFYYFGANAPEMDVPMPGDLEAWVSTLSVPPIIVLDSFTHFLENGDENSAKDVNALWKNIRKLKRHGCTFILLHHLGKGSSARDFLRGSTAIRAGLDFAFRVENISPGSSPDKDLTLMRLTRMKKRNGSKFGNKDSQMLVHIDERGRFQADISNAPKRKITDNEEILATLFDEDPGISQSGFEKAAMEKGATRVEARRYYRAQIELAKEDPSVGLLPAVRASDIPEPARKGWSGHAN